MLTVRELNYRLQNAKIIVALREDISHRVFQLQSRREPQQEKWSDVQIKVRWTKEQLVEMVNNRLREVYRAEYTQEAPTLSDILPQKRKKPGEDEPIDYLIERTLMRPRDVIDFLNRCFDETSEISRLSLADLRAAEVGYSEARLRGIVDEWANSYFGLSATFPLLRKLGSRFTPSDIEDDDILAVLLDDQCASCLWLTELASKFSKGPLGIASVRDSLLSVWYLVGIIGVKDSVSHRTYFSLDRALNMKLDLGTNTAFIISKMLRSALGVAERGNASAS